MHSAKRQPLRIEGITKHNYIGSDGLIWNVKIHPVLLSFDVSVNNCPVSLEMLDSSLAVSRSQTWDAPGKAKIHCEQVLRLIIDLYEPHRGFKVALALFALRVDIFTSLKPTSEQA